MPLTGTYESTLSRIRLTGTTLGASATYAVFDRTTDGIWYTTVRGGSSVPVSAQTAKLDDYEFPAGPAITYRVRSYNASNVLQATATVVVTQDLADVWVKVPARPFLNRAVEASVNVEVTRQARGGVFPVLGRSFPIAVSDVRGSRQFELRVRTSTATQHRDVDLLLASGEPIYLHVPSTNTRLPSGYFVIGDTTEEPTGRYLYEREFTLPVTEIAAPGPDVVGASSTWQSVISAYATWQNVINAQTTWTTLLELVGSPTEVIVP
jgi:hypothetical protein